MTMLEDAIGAGLRKVMAKVIKQLVVNEVSAVTSAANKHAQIKLLKSQEAPMPQVDLYKSAAQAGQEWTSFVKRLAHDRKVTFSKAADMAMQDPVARGLFHIAGITSSNQDLILAKLSGGDLPQPAPGHPHVATGGGYNPPLAPRSSVPGPLDYASQRPRSGKVHDEPDADDEDLPAKAFGIFRNAVDRLRQDGMSHSEAMDKVIRDYPNLWSQAKLHRPDAVKNVADRLG
jgi:hypothetical protein